MSVWQMDAAISGYVRAHTPETGEMTDSEADMIWADVQRKMGRVQ